VLRRDLRRIVATGKKTQVERVHVQHNAVKSIRDQDTPQVFDSRAERPTRPPPCCSGGRAPGGSPGPSLWGGGGYTQAAGPANWAWYVVAEVLLRASFVRHSRRQAWNGWLARAGAFPCARCRVRAREFQRPIGPHDRPHPGQRPAARQQSVRRSATGGRKLATSI
jgi:hypothetical protein